jgi:hypothetical protein
MLLFRSEEHVTRWLGQWGLPRGVCLPVGQLWGLAQAWYGADRRRPAWRRKTVEEAQAAFAELELGGEFWKLR